MGLRHHNICYIVVIVSIVVCVGACSSIPFETITYVPVGNFEPEVVREHFERDLPGSYEVLNSVVFSRKHMQFSSLGVTAIEEGNETFSTVAFNPLGVKLFELTGDKTRIELGYAIEEFKKHGDFAVTIAEDIRRMYFDRVPHLDSKVRIEKKKILFSMSSDGGVLTHIFAGAQMHLVEKRFSKAGKLVWRVAYYEYVTYKGAIFPKGIILTNEKYDYKLRVKMKEIIE